jgi:hypothetical protein
MVQHLAPLLPDEFIAEPRIHLGSYYDIGACASDGESGPAHEEREHIANAAGEELPISSLSVETEFPDEYAYELLILNVDRERELVAAVELVSPANKDRPASRHLFVAKCLNLLQKGICVSIVDLVTISRFNLYVELLELKRRRDPTFTGDLKPTYAATCRTIQIGDKTRLDAWSYPLIVGQPLPTLPIWLTPKLTIPLDLEASYESACRTFKIK